MELLGRPYNDADRMNVPLVVIAPGVTDGRRFERPVAQTDVMPTVAGLLGVPLDSTVHFGRDLATSDPALIGMRYYFPTGTYIDDEFVVVPRTDSTMEVWDARTREPVADPPTRAAAKVERVIQLQMISDAYVDALPPY